MVETPVYEQVLKNREAVHKYRLKNKEKYREARRLWAQKNKDRINKRTRALRKAFPERFRFRDLLRYRRDKEKRLAANKMYYENNREKLQKKRKLYERHKLKTDPKFRLTKNLRRRMLFVLRGERRAERSLELLGCTVEELREHLSNQFKDGMSWDNYGKWHIDHIIPCASFDFTKKKDQKKCFHYSNLQPLWAKENIQKSNRGIK